MPSGSVRSVDIGGLPFNVAGDANISNMLTQWEVSRITHSGGSMKKMVKRTPIAEGVKLILDGTDRDNLRLIAEGVEDITLQYETLAGDVYSATGSINVEGWESEDNIVNVIMQPATTWTPYVNS